MLDEARVKHYEAHVHWEWWTASNGSYFHNPDQAQDSINKGIGDLAVGHQAARRGDGQTPCGRARVERGAGPCCNEMRACA